MADQLTPADGHRRTIRRLAAIDIAFLGPTFILAEYTLGVFGCGALGVLMLRSVVGTSTSSPLQFLGGMYLLLLGVNYVPLLLYSLAIVRRGDARAEMAYEVAHKAVYMGKYRVYSLLLLLPLVVPVLALIQSRQRSA